MNKFTTMLAGVSMLVVAGGVSAEPMALSADQMDGVNAGLLPLLPVAAALANSTGTGVGNVLNISATETSAAAVGGLLPTALSGGKSTVIALSIPGTGAAAASYTGSVAVVQ